MLLESINHLLNQNQHEAWLDLPLKKRKHVADSLLAAAEHSLAYLLPVSKLGSNIGLEASSETIVAKPTILAQVAAVNIYDYVKFPSINLYHDSIDSVAIPKEALELVGNGKTQKTLKSIVFRFSKCDFRDIRSFGVLYGTGRGN